MVLTVYRWLLCLYPGSYREEFGAEMTCVFHDARGALPPALAAKSASTGVNASYRLLCVRTLTACSVLPFHLRGSLCNLNFGFLAPVCS
jgi:hypothetical protein